jgi:hypothetical protein
MIAHAVFHGWVDYSEGKMERVMAHPKGFR